MNMVNRMIVSMIPLLPKRWVRRFAMRYIAGEKLDDALRVVRSINGKKMMGTIDVLGENVATQEESLSAVRECDGVLHAIHENHVDANLSIKLTQFGLKMDEAFCYSNMKHLLAIASGQETFVRMDMEDSSTTSNTLKLYERLRKEEPGEVEYDSLARSNGLAGFL